MNLAFFHTFPLIAFLPVFLMQPLSAQEAKEGNFSGAFADLAGQAYGLDQDLVNGFEYYNRYVGCKGDPYFLEGDFLKGTLRIHGQEYKEVTLRFDIASQLVEMEYTNAFGGNSWIILVSDHVGAFEYGGYSFRKLDLEGQPGKFYQVIQAGPFTCYVHWKKRLMALQNEQHYSSQFTDAPPTCLLEMDGKRTAFKNRKDLVECFPADEQKQIRHLLKRIRFQVHNATPPEMVTGMHEVAALIKSGDLP